MLTRSPSLASAPPESHLSLPAPLAFFSDATLVTRLTSGTPFLCEEREVMLSPAPFWWCGHSWPKCGRRTFSSLYAFSQKVACRAPCLPAAESLKPSVINQRSNPGSPVSELHPFHSRTSSTVRVVTFLARGAVCWRSKCSGVSSWNTVSSPRRSAMPAGDSSIMSSEIGVLLAAAL